MEPIPAVPDRVQMGHNSQKMMTRIFGPLSIFLLAGFFFCNGQVNITSVIADKLSKEALSFASISIEGSASGAYSNESGLVSIKCSIESVLLISHVGYEVVKISAREVLDTLFLEQSAKILAPVEVTAKIKRKSSVKLGIDERNLNYFFKGWLSYAVRIESRKSINGIITSAKFRLLQTNAKNAIARVRVRIYSIDAETDMPGEDLLVESVILDYSSRPKYLDVDLERYGVIFRDEGVYIGLDILGYVDIDGSVKPYSYTEVGKHIAVPMGTAEKPLTVYRQFNRPWRYVSLPDPTGRITDVNASFSILVEY